MFELLQMWAFVEILRFVFLPLIVTVFHNLTYWNNASVMTYQVPQASQ